MDKKNRGYSEEEYREEVYFAEDAPEDIRILDLTPEEAEDGEAQEQTATETEGEEAPESYKLTWSGKLDVSGLDLTDVTATLRVTIVNGNTYEAGTFTGDLTEYLKDQP